jgi:SAM-dependent methyltransferase
MALPFLVDAFDVAIMALVIFFVPDPAKGVAEMARVVRSGGMVAAYAWDMLGGGFPLEPIRIEMRAMGLTVLSPPSSEASKIEVLRDLWTRAGLDAVETRDITVQRTFPDFEDFWTISLSAPSMRSVIAATAPNDIELLKARVRARLPVDATGRITYSARANAVKGRVPTSKAAVSKSPIKATRRAGEQRPSPTAETRHGRRLHCRRRDSAAAAHQVF